MNFEIGDVVIITGESQYKSLFKNELGCKWVVIGVMERTCVLKNTNDIGRGSYVGMSVYKEHLRCIGRLEEY